MIPIIISSIESPEDRDLMTEFYNKYCDLLHKEAWKHLTLKEDAEDIVYEALTKIIDKMETFRILAPAQRIQYALTTVRNLSYILAKRNAYFTFVTYDESFEPFASEQTTPEDSAEKKAALDQMRTIWKNLDIEDRMLLEQKYVLHWKDSELAEQLGIQPASVRMRLTRTKRKLMKELSAQGINLADWVF